MIVVADPKRAFLNRVKQLFGADEVVHAERLGELERMLREHPMDVDAAVIGPGYDPDEVLEDIERLAPLAERTGIVLVSDHMTPELLQTALRSGVRDVVEHPVDRDDLQSAVERARAHSARFRETLSPEQRGEAVSHRVVTVFSTKGGCGKSVIASNLAIMLHEATGEDVVLVDLDLQSGDLAIMMQLMPAWTIHDAATNLDRLDADALKGYLTEHRSGVKLLAAPTDPEQGEEVPAKAIHRILHILRDEFPYVVVDTSPSFTDEVLAALDESDMCVLVTSMDVPSIKNLKLSLETLLRLGIDRDRIKLVLNRADSKVGLRVSEVEKSLGTSIDTAVPSTRDVPVSVNQGVPLAMDRRRSAFLEPLVSLVEDIRPTPETNDNDQRRGFLRRG